MGQAGKRLERNLQPTRVFLRWYIFGMPTSGNYLHRPVRDDETLCAVPAKIVSRTPW